MAGARISAKMRAKLEQAILHAEGSIKAIREVLADDAADRAEDKAAKVLRDWTRADAWR